MVKEKNIIEIKKLNLKVNIIMEKDGMEKHMILQENKNMNYHMEKVMLKTIIMMEI